MPGSQDKSLITDILEQYARNSSATWDETKHPRGQPENAGEFAPAQGAQETRRAKPQSQSHAAAHAMIRDKLAASGLDPQRQAQYAEAYSAVLNRMPERAAHLLVEHAMNIKFYASTEHLSDAMRKVDPRITGTIGGAWQAAEGYGVLHLDGGHGRPGSLDAQGIYAHETGHVCDVYEGKNPGYRISMTPEWLVAFRAELLDEQLSQYAATRASEGFAEFARLCWGTRWRPSDIAENFPMCYAVFKAHGLIK